MPDRFVAVADVPSADFVATHRRFLDCARHCHDLRAANNGGHAEWIGDPMEVGLVGMAEAAAGSASVLHRLDEVPFEPDRKRLVTIHRGPQEVLLFVKGAPEEVATRMAMRAQTARIRTTNADTSATSIAAIPTRPIAPSPRSAPNRRNSSTHGRCRRKSDQDRS